MDTLIHCLNGSEKSEESASKLKALLIDSSKYYENIGPGVNLKDTNFTLNLVLGSFFTG